MRITDIHFVCSLVFISTLTLFAFIFFANPSSAYATEEECRSCLAGCISTGHTAEECSHYGAPGASCIYNSSDGGGGGWGDGACNPYSQEQIDSWLTSEPVPPPSGGGGSEEGDDDGCGGGAFCGTDVLAFKDNILIYSAPVFGGLAMLKIIYGGILYATAGGNPQRITNAKSHISYALIGLVLILGMNIILVLMGATPY